MRPGAVLAPEYTSENLELLAAGCCNMQVSVQWHCAWALRVCVCVCVEREKRWYEWLRFLLHPPIINHPSPRLTPPPSSTPLATNTTTPYLPQVHEECVINNQLVKGPLQKREKCTAQPAYRDPVNKITPAASVQQVQHYVTSEVIHQ